DGGHHAFIRDTAGHYTVFDPPGATISICTVIRKDGTAGGTYYDAGFVPHAYLRAPDGTITSFDAPHAAQGTALGDMNKKGFATGTAIDAQGVSHGFIRNANGKFTLFDAPDAELGTFGLYINDKNQIVGHTVGSDLKDRGFIRTAYETSVRS